MVKPFQLERFNIPLKHIKPQYLKQVRDYWQHVVDEELRITEEIEVNLEKN